MKIEDYIDILEDGGGNQKVIEFLENAMIDEILTVAEVITGKGNARMSINDWQNLQEAIEQVKDKLYRVYED